MNKNETIKVLFLEQNIHPFDVIAVFPESKTGSSVVTYTHKEKFGNMSEKKHKVFPQAGRKNYQSLYSELLKQGYNLEILNDEESEPIKQAVTGWQDGRTILIYKDGGIKIIDQGADYGSRALIVNIEPEEMQLILNALKAPI